VNDRQHLSGREFERLLEAVRGSRNEVGDLCLVLLMFRHGLRVSEACGLVLEQVDIESRVLHVARLKGGLSTTHPLRGDEIRAIKAWLVERARMKAPVRSFFLSDQRKPLHRSTVNLLLHKYGEKARLPVAVNPHMLRHACGFALADQGADTRLIQDYLGHRNIQHTVPAPPQTRRGSRSCGGRGHNARKAPPWRRGDEATASGRAQPRALITSGVLLFLIRLRSLRL
jgi:integrase